MTLRYDEVYIFARKKDAKIYLYKVDPVIGGSICSKQNWRKIDVPEFNKIGLTFIGKYKRY